MKATKQFPAGSRSVKRQIRIAMAAAYREAGLSWPKIAKELGVSRKQIQRWRQGGLL